jgi:hypothetical protein
MLRVEENWKSGNFKIGTKNVSVALPLSINMWHIGWQTRKGTVVTIDMNIYGNHDPF